LQFKDSSWSLRKIDELDSNILIISIQFLGDMTLYASQFIVEKYPNIFSKIMDLYFSILNRLNKFNFQSDIDNNDKNFNNLQSYIIKQNIKGCDFHNNDEYIKRNIFSFNQKIFNLIIENLISVFIGIKSATDKNYVNYNYKNDECFVNFSKNFFFILKSNFEKYSKFISTSHNYTLMENFLNLYTDYSILFGIKYNLKEIEKHNIKEKSNFITDNEGELLFQIIELLQKSYITKYSQSLKYAYNKLFED